MNDRYLVGGKYRLCEQLGCGGMATVYKAINVKLDRAVALKLIDDEIDETRFHDEAVVAFKCKSEHLVRAFDQGIDGQMGSYIAYELLGCSLDDKLIYGALGWGKTLRKVTVPLLSALAAIHNEGIIHRDVKPGNLLLSCDGRYKLGDFGLALYANRSARTEEGCIIGTPSYMAPEQLLGGNHMVTTATDIYSAALVIVEAATGKKIRSWEKPAARRYEHIVNHSPTAADLVEMGIPSYAAKPLAQAMAPAPIERNKSAQKLLLDLKKPRRAQQVGRQRKVEKAKKVRHTKWKSMKRAVLLWLLFWSLLLGMRLQQSNACLDVSLSCRACYGIFLSLGKRLGYSPRYARDIFAKRRE